MLVADAPLSAQALCFHCGLAVSEPGRWSANIGGARRELCCGGCLAVASTIDAAGLGRFYAYRVDPGNGASAGERGGDEAGNVSRPPVPAPPDPAMLSLLEDRDVQAGLLRDGPDGTTASLMIDSLRCGACVWLIESALARVEGVRQANVNLTTGRATVRFDRTRTTLSTIIGQLQRIGYHALPYDARGRETQARAEERGQLHRLFVAGLGMMQVMMYAVPAYLGQAGEIDPVSDSLMRWASLVLTTPVVFYSAWPFFQGAWRSLRAGLPGMDVPVAFGIAAAFIASVWATFSGSGAVWFDTVTMFVFLLLAARFLDWRARRRASRMIDRLTTGLPETILLIDPAGATHRVAALHARVGDRCLVAGGEAVPLDATLLDRAGAFDQSLLTGESIPVTVAAGDTVPGGSINVGDPVTLRVLRGVAQSTPSLMQQLIERSTTLKPPLQALADHVAGWFVSALLVLAAAVWLYWWAIAVPSDTAQAWATAIAVLVVSCPCALSLATPAATAATTASLLHEGVLLTRVSALESLARVTDVVFDKTGTLTQGHPRVVDVRTLGHCSVDEVLNIAAALETGSAHPLARALVAHWQQHNPGAAPVAATDQQHTIGSGGSGYVAGARWRIGSRNWIDPGACSAQADDALAEVWLAPERDGVQSGPPVARITFEDPLRPAAPEVVRWLQARRLRVHLLSGDRAEVTGPLAQRLQIEHVHARATPQGKLDHVAALQAQGRSVLMIGDGINDAPVLAAADVSIAMSEASSLAKVAADCVLLKSDLQSVTRVLERAASNRRVVRENLGWALAYNTLAIPAAALGWITPWQAALGMTASSLLVVGNATRLMRWKR